MGKAIGLLAVSCVIASLVFSSSTAVAYKQEEVITPALQSLFSAYDSDGIQGLNWTEAMDFYNWVESAIYYRYDDENDPDGQAMLDYGYITPEQLGDGRLGGEYWQKPIETYNEGYGDCEDMAILELTFYTYYNMTSYLGEVDVDGDGVIDHAICIVGFSEEAFQQLAEYQGIIEYYDIDGDKFVIVDNAYSDAYGFVGKIDPITGEPVPNEDIDFTLYEIMTLEDIYNEWWQTDLGAMDIIILILVIASIGGMAAIAIMLYSGMRRPREAGL